MSVPVSAPAQGGALAITGASGFIGLNVVEQALAAGRRVVAFDLQPLPAAAKQAFAALPGTLVEHVGDLTSPADRARFLAEPEIGALIQAAAITPDAARERDAPGSVFAVNTAATLDCISEAVARGIPRIVAVSSVSIYGSVPETLQEIAEDTPLNPFNLYGFSKLALERGLARLQELKPFNLTIARLSPQFGRWEWRTGKRDALSALLQCLALARQGHDVVLPRDVTIDWLYAADAARGLLMLADATGLPRSAISAPAAVS
jgi:nucleoside-diphosphate-sugar epimerase